MSGNSCFSTTSDGVSGDKFSIPAGPYQLMEILKLGLTQNSFPPKP